MDLLKLFKSINKKTALSFLIVCAYYSFYFLTEFDPNAVVSILQQGYYGAFAGIFAIAVLKLLVSFVFAGFYIEFIKNETGDAQNIFPSFKNNILNFFKKGLKVTLFNILLGAFLGVLLGIIFAIFRTTPVNISVFNAVIVTIILIFALFTALFNVLFAQTCEIKKTFARSKEVLLVFKYAPIEIITTIGFVALSILVMLVMLYFVHLLSWVYMFLFGVCIAFLSLYNTNLWAQSWRIYRKNYDIEKQREDFFKNCD